MNNNKLVVGGVGTKTFTELLKLSENNEEGLVVMGAGGDLQEWVDGISTHLYKEGVATTKKPFKEVFRLSGNVKGEDGRTDLVLMYNNNLNVGKLVMWRLRFGDISWVSDFVVNHLNDYNLEV